MPERAEQFKFTEDELELRSIRKQQLNNYQKLKIEKKLDYENIKI